MQIIYVIKLTFQRDYLKTEESTDRNVSIISESSDGDVDKPKKSSKKTSN